MTPIPFAGLPKFIIPWAKPARLIHSFILLAVVLQVTEVCAQEPLPNTERLDIEGDLSALMVAGIDRFLARETQATVTNRAQHWNRDFSSVDAYEKSIVPNRERFRRMIGAVDRRLPCEQLEFVNDTGRPALVAETDLFTVWAVRWPVFEGVYGEGLWLRPKGEASAYVIALPDADQTPELIAGLSPGVPSKRQWARRLVENRCEVLVPVLVDRSDTWSGNVAISRFTNQPHREWIYRQAFQMGRHVIGYEVQKVLAAVEFFKAQRQRDGSTAKIGVIGYAEGALLGFYAGALDPAIDVVVVSGYFNERNDLWSEPIYRNLFGLLAEFGDAEIASLIAPRALLIEHSAVPAVDGSPQRREGRSGAAPGKLSTPSFDSVVREVDRGRELARGFANLQLLRDPGGQVGEPMSDQALRAFLKTLGAPEQLHPPGNDPAPLKNNDGLPQRQRRQVQALEDFTQRLLRESEAERTRFFWNKMNISADWATASAPYRKLMWEEVIGRFPTPSNETSAKSRRFMDRESFVGYEVVLDVYPDVFAWGYLLLTKNIQEPRPVVVCFHGLEGVPGDVITEDEKSTGYRYYKAFALRLAERGFIVFAPHNPYRGGDAFRQLQRRANPLGKSLFSVILAQQERLLGWLRELPAVDPNRIGLYGLSYGGKTAMRIPSLLEGYALSICSADFNEWIRKNVTTDHPVSYMFTGEYEMPEWNLGNTFNYAEMAALIAPRPFMVERGHDDGVAPDEWVAYEYAKVRRLYSKLGIPNRTEIEFFNGPHTINGVGTYEFLHRHLQWPYKREAK